MANILPTISSVVTVSLRLVASFQVNLSTISIELVEFSQPNTAEVILPGCHTTMDETPCTAGILSEALKAPLLLLTPLELPTDIILAILNGLLK